jgi:hypothetical protein
MDMWAYIFVCFVVINHEHRLGTMVMTIGLMKYTSKCVVICYRDSCLQDMINRLCRKERHDLEIECQ